MCIRLQLTHGNKICGKSTLYEQENILIFSLHISILPSTLLTSDTYLCMAFVLILFVCYNLFLRFFETFIPPIQILNCCHFLLHIKRFFLCKRRRPRYDSRRPPRFALDVHNKKKPSNQDYICIRSK